MERLNDRYASLLESLRRLCCVAVAYSGGVDSTFLLRAAVEALGRERVLAVTVDSPAFPRREMDDASAYCAAAGIRQTVLEFDALAVEGFRTNPKDRCYWCKRALFGRIFDTAREYGISAVAEGSNTDDVGDYRPGMRAVEELGALSPLRDAGLSKADIRALSRQLNLPTWDKPSFACLASRFVYGEEITAQKLQRVEQAERLLMDMGFRQLRVRVHGNLARVELLSEEIPRLLEPSARQKVSDGLKALGFDYVTLDLAGYRTGSMNLGV